MALHSFAHLWICFTIYIVDIIDIVYLLGIIDIVYLVHVVVVVKIVAVVNIVDPTHFHFPFLVYFVCFFLSVLYFIGYIWSVFKQSCQQVVILKLRS